MNLVHNYTRPTPHDGRCRVRVYLPKNGDDSPVTALRPVVVLTEPPDNPGMSVTNAASRLAAEVLAAHGFEGRLPVFIEHYQDGMRGTPEDPQTFDLVTFRSHALSKHPALRRPTWYIGAPKWSPLDRGRVEALVGQSVR